MMVKRDKKEEEGEWGCMGRRAGSRGRASGGTWGKAPHRGEVTPHKEIKY